MEAPTQQEEFLKAYEQNADALFRHCYFRLFDRDLAKDVVQEAFCRTWRYISEKKTIENMRAFLYRTALNIIIDNSRRAKEMSLEMLTEEGLQTTDDSFAHISLALEVKELEKVIEKIPGIYREALVLRHIDGFSVKEIAAILKESESVVSVRIHRAIRQVRKDLQK